MNIVVGRRSLRVAVLACALVGGSAWGDTWVWSETRNFQLDNVATAATSTGSTPGWWAMTNSSQVETLAFSGMPSTLTLAGQSYRLDNVEVVLDSTFDVAYTLYARDNFYATAMATGSAESWTRLTVPSVLMLPPKVVSWGESVSDTCWITCYDAKSAAFSVPYDLSFALDDTRTFTQLAGFNVQLGKYTTMTIFGDDNDREDTIRNDLNHWRGSLTINYHYETVTAPVPEPATSALFMAGAAGLLWWSRRRRPS